MNAIILMSKKILITGGCGFVGVNLALKIKAKNPDYELACFDNLKRRGSELNIPRLKEAGIQFLHGDIRNKEDFEQIEAVDLIIIRPLFWHEHGGIPWWLPYGSQPFRCPASWFPGLPDEMRDHENTLHDIWLCR